jgi:hypothetical protein
VTVVVGSGIAAQQFSAGHTGMQLLENSLASFHRAECVDPRT